LAQQNEFSLKNQHLTKIKKQNDSFNQQKNRTENKITSIQLFTRIPNHLKKNNKLPLFCELEHQLSRAIKRKVKFGVAP